MPTGQYDRSKAKPRVYSEEAKERLRENMRKAQEASRNSAKASAAKSESAARSTSIRTAKAIFKRFQVGMKAGDVINTGARRMTIIDPSPVQGEDGKWEQKFEQSGRVKFYGSIHEYKGLCRVYWTERPAMDNLLENARFEELGGAGSE